MTIISDCDYEESFQIQPQEGMISQSKTKSKTEAGSQILNS